MKRDMDLVRKILFELEDSERIGPISDFKVEGHDDGQVGYHLMLMTEADLIVAVDIRSSDYPTAMMPVRLTWAGHEFLEAIRDDNRWNSVKVQTARVGGFVFEVAKAVATGLMMKQLGL